MKLAIFLLVPFLVLSLLSSPLFAQDAEARCEHLTDQMYQVYVYHYNGSQPLTFARQALERAKKIFGEEHPNTATSYMDLAKLYRTAGCYAEAESLFKKALEIRRKALGEEHMDTARSYDNLAELYRDTGRYAEAEPMFKKVLEISRKVLGEEHPSTAISYNNLAELYRATGRDAEAEALLKKARKTQE